MRSYKLDRINFYVTSGFLKRYQTETSINPDHDHKIHVQTIDRLQYPIKKDFSNLVRIFLYRPADCMSYATHLPRICNP